MNSTLAHAQSLGDETLISSLLTSEPDLFPLVEAFVLGLNQRLCDIEAAAGESNWPDLKSLAHQLKGAGGSYGYPAISEVAARIEEFAHARAMTVDGATGSPISNQICSSAECAQITSMLHDLATVAGAAQRGIVDAQP